MLYHKAWSVQMAWCHQVSYCQEKHARKMLFETSSKSRKSWSGRKMVWQWIPNSWCNRWKWFKGCHGSFALRNTYWQGWGRSKWSYRCIPWNEYSEIWSLLRLEHPVSDGSYLEVYSVTNGKPVQLRQNRCDKIKARFLGHNHNACKGILNKLEAGQVGNGCASE